jgi:superfamily II DNA or RNA helicase
MTQLILRNYQEETIQKLRRSLSKNQAVIAQSPTGTGKSRVIEYLVRKLFERNIRSMTLVPSLELLENVEQYFQDLNPGIINRENTVDWDSTVFVGNIDSVYPRLNRFTYIPEYLIVDECKHSKARTWEETIQFFKDAGSKVIGFDATPTRLDGKGFAGLFDDLIIGKSVDWHIKNGSLSPFEYFAEPCNIDFTKIVTSFSDNLEVQSTLLNHPEIISSRIQRWKEITNGGEKTLWYNTNIDHAEETAKALNADFGRTIARCISSKMKDENGKVLTGQKALEKRKQYFEEFRRGEILVLTNVRIFTEGVDVPDCACIVADRYINSLSEVLQIWGRGLRPGINKVAKLIDFTGLYLQHLKPDANYKWSLDEGLVKPQKSFIGKDDESILCQSCGGEVIEKKLSWYAKNPGVNTVECPHCGFLNLLNRKVKLNQELPFFDKDKTLSKITVSNNVIQIWQLLKTFHTKLTRKGEKYKPNWVLYKLDDIENLTRDEIQFALSTIFKSQIIIDSYCVKRGVYEQS